jgi:glutamine amidotransferase
MIGIVDYGLGNVTAIANIYRRLNVPAVIAGTEEALLSADRLILPGVGAFDHAMRRLNASGLREPLDQLVLEQGKPVLGICVGMQMMGHRSDEGVEQGLGWIPGEVKKLESAPGLQRSRLPHMGWNDVRPRRAHGLFDQLGDEARFYFLHSYYFSPTSDSSVLAETEYSQTFASAVGVDHVVGVQFHPEKSHDWGIRVLHNFVTL